MCGAWRGRQGYVGYWLGYQGLLCQQTQASCPRVAARWLMDITTLVSVCTREDALVLAVIARDRAADRVPLEVPAMAIASGPAAARKAANQAGLAVRKLLRPRRH